MKAGDRVRIKNYCRAFDGKTGKVSRVDGLYVYVFPDCQPENDKYPLELYSFEVEHENKN